MFNKNNYSSRKHKPLKMLFFMIVFVALAVAISFVVMFLWNNILTDVTGVKPLNFWKAAGLLLLAKILFGGLGRSRRSWKHSPKDHWRNKWMRMNDEERKDARSRWKEHCKRRDTKDTVE